jgi:Holliday junction resolvase-like predicted endonuclease
MKTELTKNGITIVMSISDDAEAKSISEYFICEAKLVSHGWKIIPELLKCQAGSIDLVWRHV